MWRWRGRRRLKTYAATILLALVILAVAAWSALPVLVERRLVDELTAAGIAVTSLSVTAVGLHETRIADLRIGIGGAFSAAEVIASYDLAELLGSRIERIVLRDVRVPARLDASGLSFGQLGPAHESGGRLFDPALLRAIPPVTIESGRIDLATPFGAATLPIRGLLTPQPDGSVASALDVQAQSERGSLEGALALTVADGRLDAELTIAKGSATIGQGVATAFRGSAKLGWVEAQRPSISARLDLTGANVAAASFPAGTLAVDMTESQWNAQLALAEGDGRSDLDANLVVADPYGRPRLSADGTVNAQTGAWLWPALGLPQPRGGSAQLALRLEGPLPDGALLNRSMATPADVIGLLADGTISGGVDVSIDRLALPTIASIESASAQLDIAAADGTVTIAQRSDLRAVAAVAPEILRALGLPPELEAPLAQQVTASLALPESLRLVAGDQNSDAIGAFDLKLTSASGARLDVRASGHAVLGDGFAVGAFAVEDGTALLDGLALPEFRSARLEIGGTIAGKPERFEGRLHAVGNLTDARLGGYQAATVDVTLEPAIAWADRRLAVHLGTDGSAVARQIAGDALAGKLKEMAISLVAGEAPIVAIDLSDPAAPDIAYDLRLGAIKATAPLLVGGPKPLRIALALPTTRWAGTWNARDGQHGAIQISDGSISIPSLEMTARGVRADIVINPETASADLAVATITHAATAPLVTPLGLTGKAEANADRLSFRGVLNDRGKRLNAAIEVEHALAANKGQATVKMQPVTFTPGALQPHDLVPAVGSQVEAVTGDAAIGGSVQWSKGDVVSDLELLLKDISLKSPQADILSLNSVVKIDSLVPFTTQPSQQLAAGLVDVGLPLTDLVAAFRIEPGPRLVIENAKLALSGGEVSLPTVAFDLADPRAELMLSVRNVDLALLLQLAQVEGLAGTGNLSGQIPVSFGDNAITIHDAALAAAAPGTLSYAPSQSAAALLGSGGSVEMALRALNNFRYSELNLTLSREPGGDTVALMHVKGSNPDFYNGYPVELNLNISGKLDEILDRSLSGYRIPESIRKNLRDFGE